MDEAFVGDIASTSVRKINARLLKSKKSDTWKKGWEHSVGWYKGYPQLFKFDAAQPVLVNLSGGFATPLRGKTGKILVSELRKSRV